MPRVTQPIRRLTWALGALAVTGCSIPSRADLEVMQAVNDLSDAVNGVRQDFVVLADQVDSLRTIVVRQDSLLRTLANLAGVAVPSGR